MFYLKVPIGKDATISVDITDSNVFTRCVHCGKEIQADLDQVFAECEGPVVSASVFCSKDCCYAYHKAQGNELVCEDDDADFDLFAEADDD